jgi:FlaA1/EpsC-like NDP-sugar epimerase
VANILASHRWQRNFTLNKSSFNASNKSKTGVDNLIGLPRSIKHAIAISTDAGLCVLTVWLAICFRFENWVSLSNYQWLAVFFSIVLAIPLLSVFGFYHTIIRFAGLQTIMAALRAMTIYTILYSALFTVYGFPLVPRTIGVLQPLLLLIGLGIVRILASQLLSEQLLVKNDATTLPAVLIYGAGNSGQQLAASIRSRGQRSVIGFIDDNNNLHKAQIASIPVYPPSTIASLCQKYDIRDVLLAMPSLTRTRRNEIIKLLGQSKVAVRTLPSLSDLASGKIAEDDLRELDIEDLLGRDPVAPMPELLSKNITSKTVLVTGAGGSIGSELCKQISQLSPKHLILLDLSEFALHTISEELTTVARNHRIVLTPILANLLDKERITLLISRFRPDTIYHAAAYKHVPIVENNPLVGLQNNVLGTLYLAQAALNAQVSDMVLISTDKAVRPTNVMGASKRIAEMVLQAIATENIKNEDSTCFCIVRFGNVLGSSGSVVPKFREQIKTGGPITITHPDVTRYFMTIPEAAQLVIQAAALNTTHQAGAQVYLLDMGGSVKILHLAQTMIALAGYQEIQSDHQSEGIRIEFTGLRPGEKLYEELLIEGQPTKTPHPKIFTSIDTNIVPEKVWEIIQLLDEWIRLQVDPQTIVSGLLCMPIGYTNPHRTLP